MSMDLSFVLAPVLGLALVWVFRFVGCTPFEATNSPNSAYRDYVMASPDASATVPHPLIKPNAAVILGYWRLVDAVGSTSAADEKGARPGDYRADASGDAAPVPTPRIAANQPSLLAPSAGELGRNFTGGYVRVPSSIGLVTPEFTFEAWVRPQGWLPSDAQRRRLVTFGGDYPSTPGTPSRDHGFWIEQDKGQIRARVARADGRAQTLSSILPEGTAHMALTLEKITGPNDRRRATLYLNGSTARVLEFDGYAAPDGVPLIIGAEPAPDDPRGAFTSRAPWTGRIQEVVFHGIALTKAELENHVALNNKGVGSTV